MGIDSLARNKRKPRKIMMTYVLVMQLIFTVAGLSLFGVYIGYRIDPDGNLALYLSAGGLFIGIFVSFMTILQFVKSEERYERRSRH